MTRKKKCATEAKYEIDSQKFTAWITTISGVIEFKFKVNHYNLI